VNINMGETTLKKIITLIDQHDDVGLRSVLEDDNSEINQYHDMAVDDKLAVRVSPLQFAVKVKAPKCVEVLLEHGADVKMKLKTPENKALPFTALALAEGERGIAQKNDRMSDIAIYDEIVRIIKEHDKKSKKKKKAKEEKLEEVEPKPESAGKETTTITNFEKVHAVNGAGGELVSSASMGSLNTSMPQSPSSVVEMHKMTLKATQNHISIKRLEEKNEQLQKEIEVLRQDVDLLKKLVMSLDLSKGAEPVEQLDTAAKRKTMTVKVSSEKSLPKQPMTGKKKKKKAQKCYLNSKKGTSTRGR